MRYGHIWAAYDKNIIQNYWTDINEEWLPGLDDVRTFFVGNIAI